MLQITIPGGEFFDESTGQFVTTDSQTLQLEHSLISLSRWESKWKKPFLSTKIHTVPEIQDYVRCMCINQNVDPEVFKTISGKIMEQVQEYISDPQTATTIVDRRPPRHSSETVTSELIYYWMIDFGIPFECQKWHLNRLLTLIKVCSVKNTPAKRMSKESIFAQNRSLNARRRAALGSRG